MRDTKRGRAMLVLMGMGMVLVTAAPAEAQVALEVVAVARFGAPDGGRGRVGCMRRHCGAAGQARRRQDRRAADP